MNLLLVDMGNTRCKWALLKGDRLGRQRTLAMRGASARRLATAMGSLNAVAGVIAVNVAGARGARLLRGALRLLQLPPARLIRSSARAAGVVNGYPDAWRLGADRWVAALGAHRLARGRAVCVANVGTALTLDLVDALGKHRGGLIIPGPDLMRRSLLNETHGIRRRVGATLRRRDSGFFARNTTAALEVGAAQACAALIERAVQEARRLLGVRPLLFVTGGGTQCVTRALRSAHRLQPDLVLRGLAVLAGEAGRHK